MQHLLTALTKLGIWWMGIMARLPLPLLRALAWPLAVVLYLAVAERRRAVRINLQTALPDLHAQRGKAMEFSVFLHFAQGWIDRSWLFSAPESVLRKRIRIDDPHGLLHTTEPKVFFGPHFMGMDVGWVALRLYCPQPMTSLYAPQKNQLIDDWFMRGRLRFGHNHTVPRTEGFRSAVKFMRKERASMYLLPDMDFGRKHSLFVPFFGTLAATAPSLPRIAKMANAPVVPVLAFLSSEGYHVEVLPTWHDYPTNDTEADVTRMNQELERYILRKPTQYWWVHKRFKTRPQGESKLY